jgi:hypothetical protein
MLVRTCQFGRIHHSFPRQNVKRPWRLLKPQRGEVLMGTLSDRVTIIVFVALTVRTIRLVRSLGHPHTYTGTRRHG